MSQQPDKGDSHNVQGNPASKEPAENSSAGAGQSGSQVERRDPKQQNMSSDEATPQSQAQGVRGAGPGERESDLTDQQKGRSHVDEAEQMGAPGEGRVADAVKGQSSGAAGQQAGSESDLDRKKAEQAPKREAMKQEQQKEVDVAGALGQRGGPASTVS